MSYKKQLPNGNFYAVIFSSTKTENMEGYHAMDEKTMRLAAEQEGYLGYESVSNGNKSIFISYWENREAIERWAKNSVHIMAKNQAKQWYARYLSQVCLVENSRLFE